MKYSCFVYHVGFCSANSPPPQSSILQYLTWAFSTSAPWGVTPCGAPHRRTVAAPPDPPPWQRFTLFRGSPKQRLPKETKTNHREKPQETHENLWKIHRHRFFDIFLTNRNEQNQTKLLACVEHGNSSVCRRRSSWGIPSWSWFDRNHTSADLSTSCLQEHA